MQMKGQKERKRKQDGDGGRQECRERREAVCSGGRETPGRKWVMRQTDTGRWGDKKKEKERGFRVVKGGA